MRSLLALAILAPLAIPEVSTCRVTAQQTDWTETRIMRAATGPVSALDVEFCVFFEQTVAYENMLVFGPADWQVSNLAIEIEVAFDPAFAFSIIPPTVISVPNVAGSVGPFDGVLDFDGKSGQAITQEATALLTATLAVTDPEFFQKPWPVYLRTRTLPWTQSGNSPAAAFQSIAVAGGGLVVEFVP